MSVVCLRTLILMMTLVLMLSATPGATALDDDDDQIVDDAESSMCGRPVQRFLYESIDDDVGTGTCADSTDYTPGTSLAPVYQARDEARALEAEVQQVVNDAEEDIEFHTRDDDGDAVPDVSETHVCFLQDENDDLDGTCNETRDDYTPPYCKTAALVNETGGDGIAGSCDENGKYAPHCSQIQIGVPVGLVWSIVDDADCDGWTNEEELTTGCDPLVPEDSRESCGEEYLECRIGSMIGDRLWSNVVLFCDSEGNLQQHCSGETAADPVGLLWSGLTDSDCDERPIEEELLAGCNPLDPQESPRYDNCSGVPIPS